MQGEEEIKVCFGFGFESIDFEALAARCFLAVAHSGRGLVTMVRKEQKC